MTREPVPELTGVRVERAFLDTDHASVETMVLVLDDGRVLAIEATEWLSVVERSDDAPRP